MPKIIRVALTRQMVESAKPGDADYRLWDAKVPGLALRVYATGRRTYEVHWARNRALAVGEAGVVTLEGARESARRILGEVAQHGAPAKTLKAANAARDLTFADFLEQHYAPYVLGANKRGADTVANIRAQYGFLMEKPLVTIGHADFDAFKARRLQATIEPTTVNRDLDRLKAALSKAVDWKLLEANPLKGVKRISRDMEERVRFLSPVEEKSLRAALQRREDRRREERASGESWRSARGHELLGEFGAYTDHLVPLVLLALNTGLRRGELLGLSWNDIDLAGQRLTVRARSAKSGRARHVPLNAEALGVVTAMRAENCTGLLFDVQSFGKAWKAVVEEAGIEDFRFHDLRHTFASKLVMRGVDLNTVRELLGHSDIKMTLRYAHLAPEHKAAAVALLVN